MALKERLTEWTSWEGACFAVAVELGIMEGGTESWIKHKGIFWTSNPLCDALSNLLTALVEFGTLERRDEPDYEVRWKP